MGERATEGAQHAGEDDAGKWRYCVPNAGLRVEQLPAADAPWSELVHFAGSFDGYQLQHDVGCASRARGAARSVHRETGRLPQLGLTAARALLFFEQRADYMGGGYGIEGEPLGFVRALMVRIHEHVRAREAGIPAGDSHATSVGEVEDRVMDAFERLVLAYATWGGHRCHGWTRYTDPRNYFGPVVRSEADCTLRFAMELEREWPGCVHAEFPISKANFANFDREKERPQRVDLAVSDLRGFVEDETSQERFRGMTHEAFIEAKWLVKGWRGNSFEMDAKKRVVAVGVDARKLENHLQLGRCVIAAAFVVDDEDYFATSDADVDWPANVWRLVLGPQVLRRYGLLTGEADSAP